MMAGHHSIIATIDPSVLSFCIIFCVTVCNKKWKLIKLRNRKPRTTKIPIKKAKLKSRRKLLKNTIKVENFLQDSLKRKTK
jgi:hypothetical protein